MAFDLEAFKMARFERRQGKVPIQNSELKDFFGKGDKCVWKVQSLNGQELGMANQAAEKNQNIAAIIEAIQGRKKDKVKGYEKLLGVSDDIPPDIAKRIEVIQFGSVEPECDLDAALHLNTNFPVEFLLITTEILKLTGAGHVVGKPKPSGTKKKSNSA